MGEACDAVESGEGSFLLPDTPRRDDRAADCAALEMLCLGKPGPGVRIPLSPLCEEDVAVSRRPLFICVAVFMLISPSVLDLCWIVVPDITRSLLD